MARFARRRIRLRHLWIPLCLACAVGAAGIGVAGLRHAAPPLPERVPGTAPPGEIIQSAPLSVAQQLLGRSNVRRIEVNDQAFSPASLAVRVGDELRLHLHNRGSRPHNLLIPDFGIITQPVPPGGENYVAFTPGRPGRFAYFSGDPHTRIPEPGLQGELRVHP